MVLGKEWSSFLISRNESFLGYLRNIEGVWWLVLAGHTREETLASVLYLESTYFSDTPLEAYAVEYLRSEYRNTSFRYRWKGEGFMENITDVRYSQLK